MSTSLFTDAITLLKQDGSRIDDIKASVQGDKIYLSDIEVPVEPKDRIYRELPNGLQEEYLVRDADYYDHPPLSHTRIHVQKQGAIHDIPIARETDQHEETGDGSHRNMTADVLLLTVTKVEIQAILDLIEEEFGRKSKAQYIGNKTYYDLGMIGGARTFMVRSEMGSGGPSGSTVTTQEAISNFSPSVIIAVGIAFGVDPDGQEVGDILVSKQILQYAYERIGTGVDKGLVRISRGDRPSASSRPLDRFRHGELTWEGASVQFGLVLSGPKLVDNIDYRDQLRSLAPEAIGGEMEGAGVYDAAHPHKVDWIIVKAICDWADGKKRENKRQRQERAAANAAAFTVHVMGQGGFSTGSI